MLLANASLNKSNSAPLVAPRIVAFDFAKETSPVRPPLKWAGGKRWQIPYLKPLWQGNGHRRLIEPFAGGLVVTLSLLPQEALLNDINPHLVNFYRWARRGFTIDIPLRNSRASYDRARARFNDLLKRGKEETTEAAALFYYLNRTGFNGLCRFNQRGEFNVPFGRHKQINYIDNFSLYQKQFEGWSFIVGDFEKLALRPTDFIYADPPYDVEFTSYSKDGFTWDDQVRTAEWLTRHTGPVVLSNQATPRITKLYRKLGFKLRFLDAPRMISCNGDRTPAKEVLATKNL
jgi:DNA adenine methylase